MCVRVIVVYSSSIMLYCSVMYGIVASTVMQIGCCKVLYSDIKQTWTIVVLCILETI